MIRVEILSPNDTFLNTLEYVDGWNYRPAANGAGSWSLRYPAFGPLAGLLVAGNKIRVKVLNTSIAAGGTYVFCHGGEIEDVSYVTSGGNYLIELSGLDSLHELRYTLTKGLVISAAKFVNAPNNPFYWLQEVDDNANTTVNKPTLPASFVMDYRVFVYFASPTPIRGEIKLGFSATNDTQNAPFSGSLYQRYVGPTRGNWVDLTNVADSTRIGDRPMAQNGSISWTSKPEEELKVGHDAKDNYWYRLSYPNIGPGPTVEFTINSLEYFVDAESATDIQTLVALVPGWTNNGYGGTINGSYQEFYGESVLRALGTIAENTNEYFITTADKALTWLRKDNSDDVRLDVSGTTWFLSNPRVKQTNVKATRVYMVGAGNAEAVTTMAGADTSIIPAGYSLASETWPNGLTVYYLYNPALEASEGVKAEFIQKNEYNSLNTSGDSPQLATQLLQAAISHLIKADKRYKTLTGTIIGLPVTLIRPRAKLTVINNALAHNRTMVPCKGEWFITSVSYQIANGQFTTSIQAVDKNDITAPKDNGTVVIDMINQVRRAQINKPQVAYRHVYDNQLDGT